MFYCSSKHLYIHFNVNNSVGKQPRMFEAKLTIEEVSELLSQPLEMLTICLSLLPFNNTIYGHWTSYHQLIVNE